MHTLKEALKITLNKLTKEELVKQYLQLEDEFSKKDTDRKLHDRIEEHEAIFYQLFEEFKQLRAALFMVNNHIENDKTELNRHMLSKAIDAIVYSIINIENNLMDRTGLED